ncbi:hypothetical protein K402DRAFT_413641 [Aulographum hederae CBS 113979]|uniref:Guanine nucleotide exchange factor n=1 Tax=Aulographum hederae CBS 113979 TaxID=1176131 RepID=A0A6G1GW53_9PEZI|nr:hypothetical protein K402DRAFT_413641 [Aulographum hederae CBS 113979]
MGGAEHHCSKSSIVSDQLTRTLSLTSNPLLKKIHHLPHRRRQPPRVRLYRRNTNAAMAAAAKSKSTGGAGQRKLDEVTLLLRTLEFDLAEKNLRAEERNQALEELKIHGRAVENAEPIFTKDGITILARHGFESTSQATSQQALRCLANALLLRPETRQIFVDLGYADKAADRLKTDNTEDEFLLSRILFLLTYDTDADFAKLVVEHQVADSINANIARHGKRYSKNARKLSHPMAMEEMAFCETLKLIFNITHYYPDLGTLFSKSIPPLLKILHRTKIPHPPMAPPVNYLINALLNLDINDKSIHQFGTSPLFPKLNQNCNAEHMINILDRAITEYPESELDHVAAPILNLIRKVHEIAPDGVKKFMHWLLLPTDDERNQPLGKSDTLASRLLRLSSSALCPTLRNSISQLLFELSDKDATSFVRNVGYGFASGFLMSQNMAIPESAKEAWSEEQSRNGSGNSNGPINPVTGQRLSSEPVSNEPPMTDDEKEREAEKLFVLFERLKKTGVVKVKNPVEQAIDEGRFEEID